MNYLQRATAVLALDEQCDVLSMEARFTANSVLRRINELAAANSAQSVVVVRGASENVREAVKEELRIGCSGYLEAEKYQSLVRNWNNVAQTQLSVFADIDLQKSCGLETQDYSLLREQAEKALKDLQINPENQWKPARDHRIGYYKRQCRSGNGLKAPLTDVVEVAEELAREFKNLQAANPPSQKSALFKNLYGLRDAPQGQQAFLKTSHRTHPSEITITETGSLIVKPASADIATVSIGINGTDTFRNLRVDEEGVWHLEESALDALMAKAKSINRPSLKIMAESWKHLSTPIYLASIDPKMLERALSYSQAPKP